MLYILCYILCSTFYVIFYVIRGKMFNSLKCVNDHLFMKGHRVLKRVILNCKCYAVALVTQRINSFELPLINCSAH